MKQCPEGKDVCPCREYAKEGLCDWPYLNGMTLEEARYITELLRMIEGEEETDALEELKKIKKLEEEL